MFCNFSEYTLHVDRVRGRFSITFINNEDLAIAKFEGWPDVKARYLLRIAFVQYQYITFVESFYSRLTPIEVPVQSLSREELNLLEVVEDVALQAIRRVQCDIK